MRRREFVQLAASTAMAWPLAGHTQQPERVRHVAVLLGWPENDPFTQRLVSAFAQALRRFGWVEGKNIVIDYRFAAGDPTLFKPYAAELVTLASDAILASPGPSVAALRELTHTIPIVGVLLGDPVGLGYVQSFPRPGGNITGFTSYEPPMMGKWLQLLKEIAPSVTHVAVIYNPDTSNPGTASVPLAARCAGGRRDVPDAHQTALHSVGLGDRNAHTAPVATAYIASEERPKGASRSTHDVDAAPRSPPSAILSQPGTRSSGPAPGLNRLEQGATGDALSTCPR